MLAPSPPPHIQERGGWGVRLLTVNAKTATIAGMELVQLKSLFAELKQKASDLRGFL